MEARSLGRLRVATLAVVVAASIFSPSAEAAVTDEPVALVKSTVEQTVGTAGGVTGQVTTAVGNAAPPVQPLTTAAQDTTTELTRQVTTVVEKAAPPAQSVVDKAAGAVTPARPAPPQPRQAPTPPDSAPSVPRPSGEPQAPAPRDTTAPRPGSEAPAPPAPERRAYERRDPVGAGAERVAPDQPLVAQPVTLGERPHAGERAPEPERGVAPAGDVPALGGGSASAPLTGVGLGGLALLALAFCLTAPRVVRSLLSLPADMRPALLVSALERPG